MKKRIAILVLMGIICLAGCSTQNGVKVETAQQNTRQYEEETQDNPAQQSEAETHSVKKENTNVKESASKESITYTYNTFLDEYKDDLANLHIFADTYAGSELIERDDAIEITNAIVTKDYYLDADVIENMQAGDSVRIEGIEYKFTSIELENDGWYSVEVSVQEPDKLKEDQYLYEDIYGLQKTEDGKHYIAYFCSDDIIQEEIYSGSVFFDKDCLVGLYENEELLKEYFRQEYSFINSIGCELNEKGLVQYFYNQMAG